MTDKCILVVEDDPKILEAVEAYLVKEGYKVLCAEDGKKALEIFEQFTVHMAILDIMLPFISGTKLCHLFRQSKKLPIIMLTAKSDEESKINGLNFGADDYMVKPFSPKELVARVNRLFMRCYEEGFLTFDSSYLVLGIFRVDFDSYCVYKDKTPINLTTSEFKLFTALIRYPNKVFTRQELIEIAFGYEFDGFDRTIDAHIKNLRSKIEDNFTTHKYILTVRGVGYKFGGGKIENES